MDATGALNEIKRRTVATANDTRTAEELAAAPRCIFHPDRPVAPNSDQCGECQQFDFLRAISQVGMLDAE